VFKYFPQSLSSFWEVIIQNIKLLALCKQKLRESLSKWPLKLSLQRKLWLKHLLYSKNDNNVSILWLWIVVICESSRAQVETPNLNKSVLTIVISFLLSDAPKIMQILCHTLLSKYLCTFRAKIEYHFVSFNFYLRDKSINGKIGKILYF